MKFMVHNNAISNKHISKCILYGFLCWTHSGGDWWDKFGALTHHWFTMMTGPFTAPPQILGTSLHHITSMRVAQASIPTPPDPNSSTGHSMHVLMMMAPDVAAFPSSVFTTEGKWCIYDNMPSTNVWNLQCYLAFVWTEIDILMMGSGCDLRAWLWQRWRAGKRYQDGCCCSYATLNSFL